MFNLVNQPAYLSQSCICPGQGPWRLTWGEMLTS